MKCYVVVWGEFNEGYDIVDIYKNYQDAVNRLKCEATNYTKITSDRYEHGSEYIEIQTYSVK